MRKEKLIISLVVMMIVFVVCSITSFAADTGTQPITLTGNSSSNTNPISIGSNTTGNSNTNGTPITSNNNSSTITPITGTTNSNTNSSSVYPTRNQATQNTESSSDLPYTGVNYGVVFVIIALGVSAIYAYKKVSDYNM